MQINAEEKLDGWSLAFEEGDDNKVYIKKTDDGPAVVTRHFAKGITLE